MESIKRGEKRAHFPDAYVSCDLSFTKKVEQWFESATIILQNDLVLIVPKDNPKGIRSLEDLKRKDLRIGMPHPKNSAMGAIVHDLLKNKLNFPEYVYTPEKNEQLMHTDAAHFLVNQMRTGALDVAIVGRSNAMSTPANVEKHLQVIDIDVPGALARQTFAIAKETKHKHLMERLLQALVAPSNLARFKQLGFKVEPRQS
jgi:ABC-type molybdate transport system substrate-binding protein